ncbi:hypothetical protein OIU84_008219 [Salix udensis]|uniref:Endonuclease/exonuclease/phosphatase domain-containing protein n=1 Tax=Salix udensis TaxID=889485 RepID=A0AAD6JW21_9ROSI|nr:hypothetical protein OIU84_008219 [Salix udensis]
MHILHNPTTTPLKLTIVYGDNTPAGREALWEYIERTSMDHSAIPWLIMGDFNAVLSPDDRQGGRQDWCNHHNAFGNSIQEAELFQTSYTGMRYTWHNGHAAKTSILRKLDWVFSNSTFYTSWPTAKTHFYPRNASDHSAAVTTLTNTRQKTHYPFKFLNLWTDREEFILTVRNAWDTPTMGNPIQNFAAKLKAARKQFQDLHRRCTSHISSRVKAVALQWVAAQHQMERHPNSMHHATLERDLAKLHGQLTLEEEAFYRQKSRIQWLHLGDRNTKFFHKSLIHRQSRNTIHSLNDGNGNIVTGKKELGLMAHQLKPPRTLT